MSKYIIPRIYLIGRTGVVVENYDSMLAAAEALRPLRYKISIGETHQLDFYHPLTVWRREPESYDYILRDDRSRHVSWADLDAAWDAAHPRPKGKGRWWRNVRPGHEVGGERYRREPVAGVWKRNPSRWGAYYRNVQTTQERRENDFLAFDEDAREYGIKPRARRNAATLVNPWDDIYRHTERNWKRQRRTQYKTA